MVRELRVSNRQRRKYIFLPLIKLFAVFLIGSVISVVWFDIRNDQLLMVIGLAWVWVSIIHILPLVIMGIRHIRATRESYLRIDTANRIYQYKEKDLSLSFQAYEIEKVIKVVSPPKYDNRMDFLGFGYFFYWKIIFADGTALSISCMLLDDDEFSGKKVSYEKQSFPIPPSNQWMAEGWR